MGKTSFTVIGMLVVIAVVIAIILVRRRFWGRGDQTEALQQVRNPQHEQQVAPNSVR